MVPAWQFDQGVSDPEREYGRESIQSVLHAHSHIKWACTALQQQPCHLECLLRTPRVEGVADGHAQWRVPITLLIGAAQAPLQ